MSRKALAIRRRAKRRGTSAGNRWPSGSGSAVDANVHRKGPPHRGKPGGTQRIFVSYRRKAPLELLQKLYDALVSRYGEGAVFRDDKSIRVGERFPEEILATIDRCNVMVVVISKDWVSVEKNGKRRLDDPTDWVRREVVRALERHLVVLPVTLDGVAMPEKHELPVALDALADISALPLRERGWNADIGRLFEAVDVQADIRLFKADSALRDGRVLRAIEELALVEVTNTRFCAATTYESLARLALRTVKWRPAERHQLPPRDVHSIDVCEGDWWLALGYEGGGAAVARLRGEELLDGTKVGPEAQDYFKPSAVKLCIGAPSQDLPFEANAQPTRVRFYSGGTSLKPLHLVAGSSAREVWLLTSQSGHRVVPREGLRVSADLGVVTMAAGPCSARYAGPRGDKAETHEEGILLTVSGAGLVKVTDFQRPSEESSHSSAHLGEPLRVHVYGGAYTERAVVCGTAGVVLVAFRPNVGFIEVRGRTDAAIRDAAALPGSGWKVVMGYDDGRVEVHTQEEKSWSIRVDETLSSSVRRVVASTKRDLFFASTDQGHGAIYRGTDRVSVLYSPRAIRDAVFIDECRALLTVDDTSTLARWDVTSPGELDSIELGEVLLFVPPGCTGERWELAVADQRLLVCGPDRGVCRTWRVEADGTMTRVSQPAYVASGLWSSIGGYSFDASMLAWAAEPTAACGVAVGAAEHGAPGGIASVSALVYRVDEQGQAMEREVELRLAEPLAVGAAKDGVEFAVLQRAREVGESDDTLLLSRIQGATGKVETTTLELPRGFGWSATGIVRYSPSGRFIVVVPADTPWIHVIDRESSTRHHLLQVGPRKREEVRGPHCFSPRTDELLVSLLSGDIVAMDLSVRKPTLRFRYEQPMSRYIQFSDRDRISVLSVSTDGSWLVAAAANRCLIWRENESTPRHCLQLEHPLRVIAFGEGSSRFVTVDTAGRSHVRSAESGHIVYEAYPSNAYDVVFVPGTESFLLKVHDDAGERYMKVPFFRDVAATRKGLLELLRSPN